MSEKKTLSCSDCGVLNCARPAEGTFPAFCLTTAITATEREELKTLYQEDPAIARLTKAAAEVEGTYYGRLTRVEEIVAFAKRIGAKKIGLATCIGLSQEAKVFARILAINGLENYSVLCKVGAIDKTEIGIPESMKVNQGCHESLCNPVMQARLLNREKTDLNVIIGLCVGHDSMFIKYSEAPVTTLIVKDRVLGHNPAAALYNTGFYYKRLLEPLK
ncbi:DUF1847 domain-containing protein [Heliophilum fasciatum]|uniref:Putative metal-binding protein n=1 Tax=Heliophilum fasciatum TaxID=35700 RepID=A0A4R2RZK1_9FIRM|nr:DUF1847 domain-containing protein [Heliophilum fasciatum]MCW2276655.1 putative metal-binding protein [Heliophilum fasciatum]TCP68964.1 putative metal-binding protein [Heliophilum fasciatum]